MPCVLNAGNCFGMIFRNRTIHIVVVVLELHMDYTTKVAFKPISKYLHMDYIPETVFELFS